MHKFCRRHSSIAPESLHEQHDAARDNDALSLATTPPAAVGDML